MSKEYLQKLVASEQHLKHVAMKLAAEHLAANSEEIVSETLYTFDYDPGEDAEEYAEQEQETEVYSLFAEPVTRTIEKLAAEWKKQSAELAQTCICSWPDDERVYPVVRKLLEQLPLPRSSAFRREDDEGYRLVVNGELVYEHLGPDEAIEATRQYVQARTFPTPPPDGKEDLN